MRHTELDRGSIERTLEQWGPEGSPRHLLALLPEAEKDKLPLLQAACRERGISLHGGLFPALLTPKGFSNQGAWLLQIQPETSPFLIPTLNADPTAAVERIVAEVRTRLASIPPELPKPTLFLIFDSMVPNIASLLDGIYLELSSRVEYAGVNAGSETFQAMPCLFDESRLVSDGVLGLLLPGDFPTILEHGFVQPEKAMFATSTEGNRIAMIDWLPAFEVYQAVIKSEYGIDLNAENFYEYAVHFPFGILRANGEVVVRIPVALADDGALFCVGEVPENAMLVLLKAPGNGDNPANACVERLADKLATEQAAPCLLTFYCAGRRMHLGSGADDEITRLQRLTGSSEIAGALSLGEIGSTRRCSYPMFHNATILCRPWPAR